MKAESNTVEDKVWVSGNYIRTTYSVSRTTAYEIIRKIEKENDEPDAVLRFGRCLRVRKDLVINWFSNK
jgi:hypothetical protein